MEIAVANMTERIEPTLGPFVPDQGLGPLHEFDNPVNRNGNVPFDLPAGENVFSGDVVTHSPQVALLGDRLTDDSVADQSGVKGPFIEAGQLGLNRFCIGS